MLRMKLMLGGLALGLNLVSAAAQKPAASGTLVYVGTLGDAILGARLDTQTGQLALLGPVGKIPRPTWLVVDPNRPILYSVEDIGDYDQRMGGVFSFAIDPGTGLLKEISHTNSGGHGATYISYDSRVSMLFVGNFGGGQVAAVPVGAGGAVSPPSSVQIDTGTGPNGKQNSPHAHGATLDPGGHFVLTPDMGADRIFVNKFDSATKTLIAADTAFEYTGANTGPRHLVFSPDGNYVFALMELSSEIRCFSWNANTGQLHQVQATRLDPPEFKGTPSAAELVVSNDGRYLYVSNRGENLLQVFAIDKNAGTVTHVQDIAPGGERPRSFGIDPSGKWLIVANESSNTLTEFAVDKESGKLSPVGSPLSLDMKPVAFAFYATK